MEKLCVISFTSNGGAIAHELVSYFNANSSLGYSAELPPEDVNKRAFVETTFSTFDGFVFVGATGIAVRYIAPLLKSKDVDPAVLVMDEAGRYVISLVSGHLGGANRLSEIVSCGIGAIPVITTATDINDKFAIDIWSKRAGCIISDISKIRHVSSAVLRGEKVGFTSDFPIEGRLPEELTFIDFSDKSLQSSFYEEVEKNPQTREIPIPSEGYKENTTEGYEKILKVGVAVSLDPMYSPFEITLNAIPKIIYLGVGCRKNTDGTAFEEFILSNLEKLNLPLKSIDKMGSIDLKSQERCIQAFSEKYKIPFLTATKEELNKVQGEFTGSEFVKSITGVDNVCERSAMWLAGKGRIIAPKESHEGMTFALAIKDWKCSF